MYKLKAKIITVYKNAIEKVKDVSWTFSKATAFIQQSCQDENSRQNIN